MSYEMQNEWRSGMPALIEDLRDSLPLSELNPAMLRQKIGEAGVTSLRRQYFPRYRPGLVHVAPPSARAHRKVAVEDEFEKSLVLAVAPRDIEVTVSVEPTYEE